MGRTAEQTVPCGCMAACMAGASNLSLPPTASAPWHCGHRVPAVADAQVARLQPVGELLRFGRSMRDGMLPSVAQ